MPETEEPQPSGATPPPVDPQSSFAPETPVVREPAAAPPAQPQSAPRPAGSDGGPESDPQAPPLATVYPAGDPTGQVFVAEDDDSFADPGAPVGQMGATSRPSALRTATVVSGRIVLGIVIVGIIAIVVGAASVFPLAGVRSAPVSTVVTPVPTVQQLVCPGGLLRLGTSTGANASSTSALGSPQIASGAVPGEVIPSELATTDAGTGKSPAAPRLLTTPPVAAGAAVPVLAGAQSQSISSPEFTGLAAAACAAPSASTWLVGGATSVGRTTLLLLANPTAVPSTVALQIFGENGRVSAAGTDGIVVGPDSQSVISLAGFAPGLQSPVVQVTSTGGQIVASLEQSTIRGITPGGIDFVGGQARAARSVVIPGVIVSGSAAIDAEIGTSADFQDLQSTLRVFAPGGKDARVTISVLSEDGMVTGDPMTATIPAGTVADIPLTNLSDGDYTVVVSAKVPVVASARVSTIGTSTVSSAADFAWAVGAPLLTGDTVFSVAPNMTPLLHLDNPTDTTETVRIHALAGHSLTATVAPNSATAVPVVAGISYELEGLTQLYASVSGSADGGVTSYVVTPAPRGAGRLRVYG